MVAALLTEGLFQKKQSLKETPEGSNFGGPVGAFIPKAWKYDDVLESIPEFMFTDTVE